MRCGGWPPRGGAARAADGDVMAARWRTLRLSADTKPVAGGGRRAPRSVPAARPGVRVQDGAMIRRYWLPAMVGLLGVGAILLMVGTREAADRWVALGLVVPGLLVGAAAAAALAARRRTAAASPRKTMAARVNDVAFMLVVVAVWALLLALLDVWSGLVTGLLVGAALGLARPRTRGA